MAQKPGHYVTRYRDSVDGQFVKKREAEQRPRETEKERIRVPAPSNKPKK